MTMIVLFVNSSLGYSQTICDGKVVMPAVTFDQCNTNPWILVFEDNFDGIALDTSKWEIQQWAQGALYGINGKSQEYNTLDNAIVSDGLLKIIAKNESIIRKAISWKPDNEILSDGIPNLRPYNYTSSNIWTKYKFTYGKFEARIKIPKGKGFWPALWTFGGNPWNEIDIFEFWNEYTAGSFDVSKLSKVHHMTVHYDYDNNGSTNKCETEYTGIDFSQDFHIFTVTWEKDKIEWMVDGVVKRTDYRYYSILGQTVGCTIEALQQYIINNIYPKDPMSIILNLAIQNGDNSPDYSTIFPSQMEIDWIRYYQKNPLIDITLNDSSQYPIFDSILNVIIGENITINCDYSIHSNQLLTLKAQNSITLKPGFCATSSSTFYANIDSTIGSSTAKSAISEHNDKNLLKDRDPYDSICYKQIIIIPNPNRGSFIIDFGLLNHLNYNVVVTDDKGKIIYTKNNIDTNKIFIDLKENGQGLYILYLINGQERTATTHKIIIQ